MTDQVRAHGVTAFGPLQEALARLTGWRAAAVAALLGAFSALAYAPFHVTPVLVVSLVALVWMIDGARGQARWGKAVFARGWAFGFGFFLVSLHWTASPFLVEPEKHAVFLWMPLILLPGGMALIWGAFMAMAGAFWSASPSRIFIFTVFFALAEYVRGTLFGGFPWNLPGTSWVPGGAMSQAASLGGVYWLTIVTVFACAAPAAMVDTRDTRGLVLRLTPAFSATILLALLWAWGGQRLSTEIAYTDQTIVLMDVGVPQAEKYTQEGYANPDVFRRYLEFLRDVPGEAGDIVIWPEGAIGGLLLEARQLDPTVTYLRDRTLIAGTVRYSVSEEETVWYNAIAVLSQESAITGPDSLYNKHRLVPVGELPVAEILPFGGAIASILPGAMQQMATNGFSPGVGPTIVYGEGIPDFVAMICYEALYPSISIEAQNTAGHRAEWLVVVSNDGWFGNLIGPAQHYAQNRYRSIETGLPMARVASRGASAIIDGYGRETLRASGIANDLPGWRGRIGRGRLPEAAPIPPFMDKRGQAMFPLTLSLFVLVAFLIWRR